MTSHSAPEIKFAEESKYHVKIKIESILFLIKKDGSAPLNINSDPEVCRHWVTLSLGDRKLLPLKKKTH